jgi:Cof subfamily protein (haloacid dehalogenase superfamily)
VTPTAADLPVGLAPGGRLAAWRGTAPGYVVCDVDGTLVGPHLHASDEVVAAVAEVQAAGMRVGVATGRMRLATDTLVAQLGARGPHVLSNGAEVRDADSTIAAWTLTPPQVDALLDLARGRDDLLVEIYTETAYHVSRMDTRAEPHWQMLEHRPAGVIARAAELGGAAVLKATVTAFEPGAAAMAEEAIVAAGLAPGPAGSPRTPQLSYVNATHPDTDKGRALARAAEALGLPLAATVAVGDAANDLSMLAVAGTAVAMGQADDVVKDAAHVVVPDVDADGVAVALRAVTALGASGRLPAA